jgi:hypothetical protein
VRLLQWAGSHGPHHGSHGTHDSPDSGLFLLLCQLHQLMTASQYPSVTTAEEAGEQATRSRKRPASRTES